MMLANDFRVDDEIFVFEAKLATTIYWLYHVELFNLDCAILI